MRLQLAGNGHPHAILRVLRSLSLYASSPYRARDSLPPSPRLSVRQREVLRPLLLPMSTVLVAASPRAKLSCTHCFPRRVGRSSALYCASNPRRMTCTSNVLRPQAQHHTGLDRNNAVRRARRQCESMIRIIMYHRQVPQSSTLALPPASPPYLHSIKYCTSSMAACTTASWWSDRTAIRVWRSGESKIPSVS
ncbi:hypothetical protein C8Q72DRAFT_372065 [Fomitopsis betulina]|nr:hypothetical protein C8Q72DRAFT_372065 [Fomitopsis betulina]